MLKTYSITTVLDTEVPRTAGFLGASHLGRIPMGLLFSDTLL